MDSENVPQREMPRYISCKQVWALKIESIVPVDMSTARSGFALLQFEDKGYAPIEVSLEWLHKRGAKAGGYYVVYDGPDGYASWSPAEAFEKGCTPASEWGMPRHQETKYGVNLRGKLSNRATGIEVTEPVFVIRAKDTRALPILMQYREMVPTWDTATRGALDTVILSFDHWRESNLGDMKEGDSKGPVPPVPHSIEAKADGTRRSSWPFPSR